MSSHRERVVRGEVSSEHVVHLFDETESLVASVSSYLRDGWKRGDHLLVVARPGHWAMTSAELEASGCPVAELLAAGRLVALDAATTLATIMAGNDPHPERFRITVGALVGRLASTPGSGLTIYGEMVDLLAAHDNLPAAERLEALWNELAAEHSIRLLCGYSAAHFGDERMDGRLTAVCAAHTASCARSTDLLSTWLLSNRRSRFHLEQQ
jgi:hypothetical protein